MRRLITFGDSWTAGHAVEDEIEFKENANPPKYIQKLREQNSWSRWLAEKLGVLYVNMGVCGYGNEYIRNDIKTNQVFFKQDDIIIVMFSYPHRYRKIDDKNGPIEYYNEIEEILKNKTHFYFNAFYPLFKDEDFDVSNLPDIFINPTSSLSDYLKEYEIQNNASIWEYGSRSVWDDQKGYYQGDYHPNVDGYKEIANYIYEKIKNRI